MVLPSRNGAANVPQTPDRQGYYQAGKGNILNHFAGLTTPGMPSNVDMNHANAFAFDSLVDSSASTATAMAPSPVDNNQQSMNVIAASDDDHVMEDASSSRSSALSRSNSGKQSREVSLSLWKLERQQASEGAKKKNGIPRSNSSSGPRGSSRIGSRELRGSGSMGRDQSAPDEEEDDNNQSDSMFAMHISPPRRQRLASSRRSTLEVDPSATSENRPNGSNGPRMLHGVALDASFSSDSFSLLSSMEFLSRDLEEDERASKSKSDRERAFLYKKRYMDVYGLAVGLSRRVFELEHARTKLRGSNSATATDFAGSNADELRLESLCREVDTLSKELRERDSMIASLHNEQQESVRTLNELKRSQAQTSDAAASQSPQVKQAYVTQLEEHIARLEREHTASGEQVLDMGVTISAMEQQLNAAKLERSHMENSLRQTEHQLEAVHTQWLKEKSDLLEAMDDTKKKLTIEGEKVRRENLQLKKSLQHHTDSEKQLRSLAEGAQRTSEDAKKYIQSLEAQLQQAHARIESFGETENQLVAVQNQLQRAHQELEAAVSECDHLRHELASAHHQLKHANAEFRGRMVQLESRIYQAEIVRRSLHNKVMELKGNIRVFCRVRPLLRHEVKANGSVEIFNFPDYGGERRQIELIAGPRSHVGYGQSGGRETVKKYPFDFDLVFNGDCGQEDVFLEVSALIQSALDGYDVCIFAYGQTGSGKTYTMQGVTDPDDMEPSPHMGIVGRAIAHIYATIEDLRSSGWDFGVSLEMIEIYNETLRDLLATPAAADKVDLRLDSDGKPTITNSCVHPIENERAAWNLLQKALGRRATKTTNMNDRSSRSHCVISFRLNGVNSLTGDRRSSVVHLVDLAGSERLSKSGVGNDREMLKETQSINKSLSSLGNVMVALAKKSAHVPFRDSKLTHFLSPTLGGDSKTLMICNLSPLSQHREETLNSLRFAKTVNSCEIAFPSYGSRS